ncbi:MAG: hypothetical protein ABII18_13595 [bacterium]|nr:hypothetical protein [bacterium]MBU1918534.1 hypothetical protein [bacterium]
MSDVTSSDYNDYTFDSIQDYFGENVDVETLYEMTPDQRKSFFEQLYSEANLNETELAEFEEAFEDELESLHDTLYIYGKQLEDMIESGSATSAEVATYELMLDDAQDMMKTLEDDVFDDWGDAITTYAEKNAEVDAGSTYNFDPSNPQDGDLYTLTVGQTDATDGSIFNSEENADWIDTDHDGYRETNPDVDGDGIADEDFDGDTIISEADLTYGQTTASSTIDFSSLPEDTSYEVISYDTTTNTAMFKMTEDDGTFYYVQVIMQSDTKLIFDKLPTNNLDTVSTEVLKLMYENNATELSFYHQHYDVDPTPEAGSYYSIYDMKTQGNEMILEPSPTDFENGRDYTITCDSNAVDQISLNFPEDAEISFSEDADGNLILTVKSGDDTITITISGLEYDPDGQYTDIINITGGNIITEDNFNAFEAYRFSETKGNVDYNWRGYLYTMVNYEGESVLELFQDEGYNPTHSSSTWDYNTGTRTASYQSWEGSGNSV